MSRGQTNFFYISYHAPFDKCDREKDYEIACKAFERGVKWVTGDGGFSFPVSVIRKSYSGIGLLYRGIRYSVNIKENPVDLMENPIEFNENPFNSIENPSSRSAPSRFSTFPQPPAISFKE